MIDRRAFLLASGALLAPLAAEAQPTKARIGVLASTSPETGGFVVDALKQGLRELGYVEGKNAMFEIRWALGRFERLPDLARELVALKPSVIVATATPAARAAQQATTTIPIVMASADPIGNGFAKSLARPEGNVTGLSSLGTDASPKLFELLLTVIPKGSRLAVLWNPSNPLYVANIQTAAQEAGVNLLLMEARTSAEIESAFTRMAREHVGAVVVVGDTYFLQQRRQIAELALRNRLPSISPYPQYAEAGGMMSYGQDIVEMFRRMATYVDKILKGAKPGDLPIEQATTLVLAINLKTAKALGLTIPQSVLLRADRVIE